MRATSPFYAVTYFSNYSTIKVPGGWVDTHCSLMCEGSYSEPKKESKETIVDDMVQRLVNTGMIENR